MAQRLVSVDDNFDFPEAVRKRMAAKDSPLMGAASGQAMAGALTVQRLDRQSIERARTGAGKAAVDYSDAPGISADWSTTQGWTGTMQVAGNRAYRGEGTDTSSQALMRTFTVPANGNAHLSTLLRFAEGPGAAAYFGIDVGPAGGSPVTLFPTSSFVGFNSGGGPAAYQGANFGAPALDFNQIGPAYATSGDYLATIDIDANWVSFALTRVGTVGDTYSYKVSRATLTAGGKSINNIVLYNSDPRRLSGHSFGPVTAVKSLQPYRERNLAGAPTEGLTHRTLTTRSPKNDNWRIGIPASYDPRRPAPVVIVFHQSKSGHEKTPWYETRMQPATQALLDAGYIVAAAADGGDRWGNQASLDAYHALYEYVRSNFATGPLFFLGLSMGGLVALNALAHRNWPTPAAAATIGGVCDLDTLYSQSTYAADIRAAYGVATDGSDYEAKTLGYNPVKRNGHEFRGAPFRFYTSTGDTTVPPATNQEPMAALLEPYGEAEVVYRKGGHLDASQYDAADLLAFFNSYR